jgi:hypothetical protein
MAQSCRCTAAIQLLEVQCCCQAWTASITAAVLRVLLPLDYPSAAGPVTLPAGPTFQQLEAEAVHCRRSHHILQRFPTLCCIAQRFRRAVTRIPTPFSITWTLCIALCTTAHSDSQCSSCRSLIRTPADRHSHWHDPLYVHC